MRILVTGGAGFIGSALTRHLVLKHGARVMKGIVLAGSSGTWLHPCIPASLHPCIPASLHPCIPASLHPRGLEAAATDLQQADDLISAVSADTG